jgi:hypothetical protein
VNVETEALQRGVVFLLCRKGRGDVIVAASAFAERLDGVLERLGKEYSIEHARVVDSV